MITLAGYHLSQELFSDEKMGIFRAETDKGRHPVILKILKKEYPDPKDVAHLRHEFSLLKDPKLFGVIHAKILEKRGHRYALVLDDMPDAITLSEYIQKKAFSIESFLLAAIRLSQIIHKLHQSGIIHKDINPSHIMISDDGTQVKLLDFSIATQLSQEIPEIKGAEMLEGTLAYASPEQTSRMNRAVDKRTDLYSLGVTFYEMLTGHLPFDAKTPLEWVHCHIAKPPLSIAQYRANVPDMIEAILRKLLAKSVEERYLSAWGLKNDLEHCLSAWRKNRLIEPFQLGLRDKTGQFKISDKLYGREMEVQRLLETFDRIMQGSREMLLVSGYAGIGKTSLINEIHKPIVRQNGYFAAGKYEALQHAPYSGLIQAFRQLIRQILTESPQKIFSWQQTLNQALRPNGQVIASVIPEVEWLIGKQPPVDDLPPSEASHRFELVFFDFVNTFAKKEHPLVVFLDDLQWADLASLNLIRQLMKDGSLSYFLIIGAYRDNEIDGQHPLKEMCNILEKSGVIVEKLKLKPLGLVSIKNLIADTLHNEDVSALAALVEKKTAGNPFFINTFLTKIYRDHYLRYNARENEWDWEMSALNGLNISDNVVALVVHNVGELPKRSQEILQIAACIGNQFNLNILSAISGRNSSDTAKELWPALKTNLIIPLDDNYKLAMADAVFAEKFGDKVDYKFSHDRIQQATISMIKEEKKKKINLLIGRILLHHMTLEADEKKLFEIADHFNQSADLLIDRNEKLKIASLNLKAGTKARLSVAYEPAMNYFKRSISYLNDIDWKENYDLIFQSYVGYAECLHLIGKFEEGNRIFEMIVSRARTNLDKATITMLQVLSYTIQVKYEEAVNTGLKGLTYLGIDVGSKSNVFSVMINFAKVLWRLRNKTDQALLDLPKITDPEKHLIVAYYERISVSVYIKNPNLVATLCLRGVLFFLDNGYTASSAPLLISYAMMLISVFRGYKMAYRYGRLSMKLLSYFTDQRIKVISIFVVYGVLSPWRVPLRFCLRKLETVFSIGRQAGELLYTNFAAGLYIGMFFLQGSPLSEVNQKLKTMFAIGDLTGNMDTLATMRVLSRLVTVLKGGKHSNYFQEKCNQFLNRQIPISNELSYVAPGILCMIGAYLLSDLAMAKRIYFFLKKDANSMFYRTVFFQAEYYFYGALSLLSLLERATWIEKIKYKREINHCLAVMKNLSKNCKANFYAKYALLRAEIFHCQGQLENAYVWYEKAAASAKKNRFVHIEAMIYEFIANMHYRAGNIRQSKYYAKAALKLFLRWGAEFKRIALQSKYGDLAAHFNTKIKSSVSFRTEKIEKTETREIRPGDLSAIVSSSQILSSKVLLDDLLRSLIKISLDSTAAKRAFLFLEMSQSLTPVIYCEVSDPCLMLLNKDVSNDTKKYSSKVVQYVQNTLDAIVLGNAAEESIFSTDAYITKEKVKSLFCLPILRQGNLLGLFYLENRETADVFNEGRVNTLKLLSSQAAISLENARLYGAYERFVPHEVVELLDKHSVSDIQCGDFIQKNMSILICDIRSFTTLSEKMTPAENFQLMNDYLAYTEAIILDHHGFIEKIIGDSVVAIFSYSPQDAVAAGVDLLIQLKNFNQQIRKKNIQPIKIGVGINTGNIMLGVLGNRRRIDISVLGETVERATLIQTLTKAYDTPLLVSVETQSQLFNQSAFHYRFVQKLLNHTTKEQTTIFEIYSADPEEMRFAKMAIAAHYEQAIRLYDEKNYKEALKILERCLEKLPDDKVIQYYISCCQKILGEASYSGDEILP